MNPQIRLKMTKDYDLSKHNPLDKAKLYWSEAIDATASDEQMKYLVGALNQASIAGLMPVDFVISMTTQLTIKHFEDARNNTTGTKNIGLIKKCGTSSNCNCTEGCQSKISLSIAEILDQFTGDANRECYKNDY